jgi:two-component system LytT family response regulator
MTIRTLIVDDEPLARRRIQSLLKADSSFEVLAECADGASAIEAITAQKPDLVFLDVQMPGTDGFGVLEAVASSHLPAIIFVTAYDQYAVKAFDAQAVDYLLKPFKQDRFTDSLTRAKKRILTGGDQADEERLLGLLRRIGGDRGRIIIRTEGKIVFLRNSELEWVEAAGNYVRIHAGTRVHTVRDKISDFERMLPADRFIRIHRSIIVNLDAVAELQSCGGGEYVVLLRSGKELPLGRTYRENLDNHINSGR